MSRRGVSPSEASRWVFNRLAADYARRPGYPAPVVERLAALAGGRGARAADLGAGTGHLAAPLARAGLAVHAVEPAAAMLEALRRETAGLEVVPVLAAAEESGLPAGAFDLVVLADAVQWVDPARAGAEVARLLAPGGVLAAVVPSLAETPFLRALADRLAAENPRARRGAPPVARLFSEAGLPPPEVERWSDAVPLERDRLEAVLRSLSFVGPALGPRRLAALLAEAHALAEAHGGAVWAREIALSWARAGPAARHPPRRG